MGKTSGCGSRGFGSGLVSGALVGGVLEGVNWRSGFGQSVNYLKVDGFAIVVFGHMAVAVVIVASHRGSLTKMVAIIGLG